jgi:dynein heavy chain
MNTVLFQECVRYNALLAEMKVSLIQVQRALLGEVVMDEMLDAMASSFFDNVVPKNWSNVGFLSMKPLASWIVDCNDRVDFLNTWYENGTPVVFWISGFFFPQAFLTGTMQNKARRDQIAIDKLAFEFLFLDDIKETDVKEKPESGCLIFGMYLEGCKWSFDTHMLAESDPKKLFVELPLLHLNPILDKPEEPENTYYCPVYKVLSRTGTLSTTGHSTNYVIMMELPTIEIEDKWIIAGVAAFLSLKF